MCFHFKFQLLISSLYESHWALYISFVTYNLALRTKF